MKRVFILAALLLAPVQATWAGITGITSSYSDFIDDTGATSLTGPLPDIGAQGNSVTLGDATLSAGNTIFVGEGWSSLLPNERAIAISGPENLDISVNTGLSDAFGYWFHEPGSSTDKLDGCNTTCVDSTFLVEFLLDNVQVDWFSINAPNDEAIFLGISLDEVFDSVRFTESVGTHDNEFFGEMYAARVPEPSTLSLLVFALLGLGVMRGRRTV